MISSYVKKQLAVFFTMALAAALIIVFGYAHIPTVLGIGQMNVTAYFTDGAGVYTNGNVTTRGVTVGKITNVALTPRGVAVTMRLPDDTKIGADARAELHSVSAVGEQYVDLVSDQPAGPYLQPDAVIPVSRTSIPEQIAPVLDKATNLLASVPGGGLQAFLDEGEKAFQNLGPNLRTLVDSSQNLIDTADVNYAPTATLINSLGPLLDTQNTPGGVNNVRSYFHHLAHFTGVLRQGDRHLRGAIHTVHGAAGRAGDFLDDNEDSTQVLSRGLTTLGDLTRIYRPALEQVLVEYPIVEARLQRATRGNRGARATLSLPALYPSCTEGFKEGELRNPNDLSDKDAPPGSYCKIPHDAQRIVRGARNIPCLEGRPGMLTAISSDCLGDTKTPGSVTAHSGDPGQLQLPDLIPHESSDHPLAPAANQKFYSHQEPADESSEDGFEPLSQFGGQGTPASGGEASWQSLLTGPLNDN